MDIKEIKTLLTINQVLSHYNLKPDKNQRLLCPFHPDKTPSLQIYPATNTYCCFSSNCKAGTGDTIQFIQLKENCSKHEALVKAAKLLNGNTTAVTTTQPPAAKLFIEAVPQPNGGQAGFSVQSDPTFPRDTDPSVLTTISGFTHTGYW